MSTTRTRTARPAPTGRPAGPAVSASARAAGRPDRREHRDVGRHRARVRWRPIVGAAVTSAMLCGAALAAAVEVRRLTRPAPVVVCGTDALQASALAGLAHFSAWLRTEDAAGFIGEVGWPGGSGSADTADWNALADAWYRGADAIRLPVTAWSAGRWPVSYRMAIYHPGGTGSAVDTAGPQAAVIEAHPSTATYSRGVALAGGSFGTGDGNPSFSNLAPGRYGPDHTYDGAASYAYLAGRGVRLIRLAVSWERLQSAPFGPLAGAELDLVRAAIAQASAAGLKVVLDLHGYGDYALGGPGGVRHVLLGSADLPVNALADLWSRLAAATADLTALVGYGLLNEPARLAAKGRAAAVIWERASQQAVDAIRRTGSRRTLLVSGYAQMAPADWGRLHPHAWIRDPVHRVAYEAHDYFDQDNSGRYRAAYAEEAARAPATTSLCQRLVPMTRVPFTVRRSLW